MNAAKRSTLAAAALCAVTLWAGTASAAAQEDPMGPAEALFGQEHALVRALAPGRIAATILESKFYPENASRARLPAEPRIHLRTSNHNYCDTAQGLPALWDKESPKVTVSWCWEVEPDYSTCDEATFVFPDMTIDAQTRQIRYKGEVVAAIGGWNAAECRYDVDWRGYALSLAGGPADPSTVALSLASPAR